jgi:hypothetical protein
MSQRITISISMRSKKQHIRLWFECLQICHSQIEYRENLKRSSDFYKEWGEVTNIKFDHWWKEKNYLFQDTYVREVDKVSNNPNTITLSIPLNEKVSVITNEVKKIVESHQTERLIEMGKDPSSMKSKDLGVGKYSFTQKEIKGVFHYVNLEMYKIYLRLGKPPINRKFLMAVRSEFDGRTRSQLSGSVVTIPTMKQFETNYTTNGECEDQIRMVRRSLKGIEKTLANVSSGRFP